MPRTRPSIQSAPVPPGKHILTLRSVNEVESANLYKRSPDDPDTVTRWVWNWTTDARDPSGQPYEYTQWTGTGYGDERAALTALYDMILPNASREDKMNVDTDDLLGLRVEALIATRVNKKGDTVPVHRYMNPTTDQPPPLAFADGAAGDKAAAKADPQVFDPDEIPF